MVAEMLESDGSLAPTGTKGLDEVVCGFGRLGELFGSTYFGVEPDVFVEDDPTNRFSFRIGNGVRMHELPPVPTDQLYLRLALFDELTIKRLYRSALDEEEDPAVQYAILGALGLPTFYDKLLCVPLLNLAVPSIDRAVRSMGAWPIASRLGDENSPRALSVR